MAGKFKANWASGRPPRMQAAEPTEFDERVRELQLTGDDLVRSAELRRWCENNKDRCYIPEWLLKAWGLSVEPHVS